MADQDNKVSIQFEAKLDEITAALGQLSSDFKKFSNDVKDSFKGAGDVVEELLDKVKKLAVGFLSFEGMKKAVETTKDLGVEAIKLGAIFGISSTEASQFAVAIDDVHGSVEQVEHAASFLSRQLRENSDTLKRFGLNLVDANGEQKSQKQLFMDSVSVINSYAAGVDRNVAAVAMWGRGALEFQEILKLTPERLEEAKKKADELGLTLTQQGAVTVMNYRDAMQDVADVMKGLQKVIGEALMPILTTMGEWFREIGPAAIVGLKVVVNVVASAVWGLVFAIQTIARVTIEVVRTASTLLIGLGTAVWRAVHGDFDGAAEAARTADQKISDDWGTMWDKIKKDAEHAKEGMEHLWDPDMAAAPDPDKSGKRAPIHDKTLMAQLEANFAAYRASYESILGAQGQFEKVSLETERAYWQQYVNDTRLNTEEQLKIQLKVSTLTAAIEQRRFATSITALRAEQDKYKTDLEERLRIQQIIQAKQEAAHPGGGPEVEAERAKTNAIIREMAARDVLIAKEQEKHRAEMASKDIDSQEADLKSQASMMKVAKLQLLDQEKVFEDQRFSLKKTALANELALEIAKDDKDKTKREALKREIESLEQDHMEKIKSINREAQVEIAKYGIQAQQGTQGAFSNMIFDMMDKAQTLGHAMQKLGQDILRVFERIIAEKFAENIFGPGTAGGALISMIVTPITTAMGAILSSWFGLETAKTAATTTGEAARVATQTAGTAAAIAASKAQAVEEIGAYAGIAAAAAMASVAAIPVIGWAMAPEVGAATFAEALAYIPAALSAAGGFDVPLGVNPVTQLHQREMVLPEKQADVIRAMAEGKLGTSGSNTTVNNMPVQQHFHFDAPTDLRTQQQLAASAAAGIKRAMNRNG